MEPCDSCSYTYFCAIATFFENNEKSVQFFRDHKVLPSEVVCPKCGAKCSYREDQNIWRCTSTYAIRGRKKRRSCGFSVSDRKGTFLDMAKVPPWKIVLFVNHFLSRYWDHKGVIESLHLSSATFVLWRSFCCKVTDHWFANQAAIGGAGLEVEIDDALICRRRCRPNRVSEPIWLFGGVERASKRHFVVPLATGSAGHKRNRTTLIRLVKKYVKPESIIICSDAWLAACNDLNQSGYRNYAVGHSENVVDPSSPSVHTQSIERLWLDLRKWVKRPGNRGKYLYQSLARYLFVSSDSASLHNFFLQTGQLYPHKTREDIEESNNNS